MIELKVDIPPGVPMRVTEAARRALVRAGDVILASAVATAPFEPEPRHGVHMRDTGYVRLQIGGETEAVEVGFSAFWAILQHEYLDYHHEHGHAKFLELAFLEHGEAGLEMVAAAIREALGG